MLDRSSLGGMAKCLAGVLAGSLFALLAHGQSSQAEEVPPAAADAQATGAPARSAGANVASAKNTTATARKVSPYRQQRMTHKAKNYYAGAWGVDRLKVTHTASGNLIRFSYRVTDPTQAKVLVDRNATPYMVGQRSNVVLQVPVMDKVGQLRQTAMAPIAGQEYWMVFSNKGNPVKPGDRVNVVIGQFHADGLMVE